MHTASVQCCLPHQNWRHRGSCPRQRFKDRSVAPAWNIFHYLRQSTQFEGNTYRQVTLPFYKPLPIGHDEPHHDIRAQGGIS